MNLKKVLAELKRCNIFKAALAYLVTAWVIIQVILTILPTREAPAYVGKLILIILILGFALWIIFSCVYEITSEGIKKTVNIAPERRADPGVHLSFKEYSSQPLL
jgi:hypothetical protein